MDKNSVYKIINLMHIVSKNKQRAKLKIINNFLNSGKNILMWIKIYLYFACLSNLNLTLASDIFFFIMIKILIV